MLTINTYVGKYFKILILFILSGLCPLKGYSQPANDLCANATDISDGSWYAGTTQNSILNCTDFRTGNCGTPQQPINMCCGITGVEGTVWYKFTTPDAGPASVEFTASTCTPASFIIGGTTTLQGFLLKKIICADNSLDLAVFCFNPSTAAAFTNAFTAEAGTEYYLQVDTKKNTSSTCTCDAASSATCHSYCTYQVRLVLPVATPIKDFKVKQQNNHVNLHWLYDWKDNYSKFSIVRKNFFSNDSITLFSGPVTEFLEKDNYFSYNDYSVKTNGYYRYILYSDGKFSNSETVEVDFAQETYFNLVPNPSSGETKLILNNTLGKGYPYNVFNSIGQVVKSGVTVEMSNSETMLNIADFPSGIYYVNVVLENKALQQALVLE